MKALIVSVAIVAMSPAFAYVNYDSSGDASPSAYTNRVQSEIQQDLSQQRQDQANQAASRYYNNQGASSYGSPSNKPSR
jgi:hypothetical protein